MLHHFFNLLKHSLYAMPGLVSSNWLGWAWGLFVFAVYEILALLVRGWQDMKQRWKQNVGMGIGAAFLGYVVLFGISVVKSVYDDHQSLVAKIAELQGRKADARNEIAILVTGGSTIRDEWQAFMRKNSNRHLDQSLYAKQAEQWHGQVVGGLTSIPQGTIYVTRLNAVSGTGCGGWPLGIDYQHCDDFGRLLG